jgi:Ni,Fe-hydrogenase maturation factor
MAGVEAIAVYQLTPELAAQLAEASRVVFVDAAAGGEAVNCREVRAAAGPAALGHLLDPGGLIELAAQAFGRAPEAWLLTIPAAAFRFGEGLSPVAEAGLNTALNGLHQWFDRGPDLSSECPFWPGEHAQGP